MHVQAPPMHIQAPQMAAQAPQPMLVQPPHMPIQPPPMQAQAPPMYFQQPGPMSFPPQQFQEYPMPAAGMDQYASYGHPGQLFAENSGRKLRVKRRVWPTQRDSSGGNSPDFGASGPAGNDGFW
ncbi:hypothetical protein TWF481_011950 [Arthrobotrys musiformis]|uniref:DAZ-associated protein 2 n=1 Tax=Arthrobotrys musiformis TaxID=47236 RepID=A0AAV9VY12_9PEZI